MSRYKRADMGRTNFHPAEQNRNSTYLERWAAIYNLALTIPRDRRFDMGSFGTRTKTACSTSACLAGHAMLNGWFEKRGLRPGEESTITSIFFDQSEWFGLPPQNSGWEYSPFDPYWTQRIVNRNAGEDANLTPILMSEVVMAWMLHHWPKEEVDAAIEATKDVKYSVDDVHRLTPWKGLAPGLEVPLPPEQEVKTP